MAQERVEGARENVFLIGHLSVDHNVTQYILTLICG
jgi:hypothetical protein